MAGSSPAATSKDGKKPREGCCPQPPALVADCGLFLALRRSRLRRVDQNLNFPGVACLFGFSKTNGFDPGVV